MKRSPAAGLGIDLREVLLPDEVAPRAHAIWLARGKPEGTHQEDWFEAERQLRHERKGIQPREVNEARQARDDQPSTRDRMVSIGRGNQQAGRQGS